MFFKVRINGAVEIRAIYNILGVDIGGKKDVLGLYTSENEGAKFWLSVLTDLKARGVEDILIDINNLVLGSGGKTSQIDHLVFANHGLFVIETKNVKGWIFGKESSEFWTQVIYKRKERLYNPIRQNRGHIQALRVALEGFPEVIYVPIVAFSSSAALNIEVSSEVVYTDELLETIRDYSELRLSDERRDEIFTILSSLNVSHSYSRREHIQAIKRRIDKRERLVENGICARCGNDLLLRKGSHCKFLGCSGFPRCSFTENLD